MTARVRDAFSEASAWITDVHFFSGVQTSFTFEIAGDQVPSLAEALVRAGLAFDGASRAAIADRERLREEEVNGTLAVTFADGDPDLTHEVPAVPG